MCPYRVITRKAAGFGGASGQRFRIREPWIRIVEIPARRIVLRNNDVALYSAVLSANSSRRRDDYGSTVHACYRLNVGCEVADTYPQMR